jgi:hypothetical protein
MKLRNYPDLRIAQLEAWCDRLNQDPYGRIPLDQLRAVLKPEQMAAMLAKHHELGKEYFELRNSYPDLSGEAALYWKKAQEAARQMARARSDKLYGLANKIGEEALALWEDLPPREQALFHVPHPDDPPSGRAGFDNLEWELPRLKSLAADRPEFENIDRWVQLEALVAAIGDRRPEPKPTAIPVDEAKAAALETYRTRLRKILDD